MEEERAVSCEPQWVTGNLGLYKETTEVALSAIAESTGEPEVDGPLQQSDLLRPILMDIARHGIVHAYEKYRRCGRTSYTVEECKTTKHPKKLIVVGAGMAGMVAAYELQRAGHTVQILEAQDRAGGRVRTYDHNDGFEEGLTVDAGAMRLPCPPDKKNKTHFLTSFYTEELFKLEITDFINSNENTFLKFYNYPLTQAKDWKDTTFSELWPGWDRTIRLTGAQDKYNITNINTYFELTIGVVMDQLRILLSGVTCPRKRSTIWTEWVNTWSHFPIDGYLQSTRESIAERVPANYRIGLDRLNELLPWPEAAATAFEVFFYTPAMDTSLVELLREFLGHWWAPHMHTIKGGMSKLPNAFKKELKGDIVFNFTVSEIEFESPPDDLHKKVTVRGFKRRQDGKRVYKSFEANSVIITTPVNILRQLKFINSNEPGAEKIPEKYTPPMPMKFYKAIEDIWYGPSSKIMLQCKTRFWETEYKIQGGFTKTNLPVGQIHYPSNPGFNTIPKHIEGGILLVYTWKSEALLFGSLQPELAVEEAVDQIAEIHPQIKDEFQFGAIKAWYNDPAEQGAYALLKPRQVQNVRWLMYPWKNVYFAGDAISFAPGWIQGALESGLRAAYQFYARNESSA